MNEAEDESSDPDTDHDQVDNMAMDSDPDIAHHRSSVTPLLENLGDAWTSLGTRTCISTSGNVY